MSLFCYLIILNQLQLWKCIKWCSCSLEFNLFSKIWIISSKIPSTNCCTKSLKMFADFTNGSYGVLVTTNVQANQKLPYYDVHIPLAVSAVILPETSLILNNKSTSSWRELEFTNYHQKSISNYFTLFLNTNNFR